MVNIQTKADIIEWSVRMTEKRYFKRMWGDEFYIFDSETISEKEFDEKVDYEGYEVFVNSLMSVDVVDLLNSLSEENEQLQARNDRQAETIGELYNLIEKEDWEALTQIMQDFKDCEEQLRKEWKRYE